MALIRATSGSSGGGGTNPTYITDIWYNGSSAQTYTFTQDYAKIMATNHSDSNMTYSGNGTKTTIYRGNTSGNHWAEIICIENVKSGDTIRFPLVSSSFARVIAEIVAL